MFSSFVLFLCLLPGRSLHMYLKLKENTCIVNYKLPYDKTNNYVHQVDQIWHRVMTLLSCSTQLSMKLQLLIKPKLLEIKIFLMLKLWANVFMLLINLWASPKKPLLFINMPSIKRLCKTGELLSNPSC